MASYKFHEGPLKVESPGVKYTDNEIIADYVYETVTIDGNKVRSGGGGDGGGCM